jgi:hemerythrin superfamily protein
MLRELLKNISLKLIFRKLYKEVIKHEEKSRGIVYKRQKELEINYKSSHITQVLAFINILDLRAGLLITFNVDKLYKGMRRII